MYDYHVHSNYSDGDFLASMIEGAVEAGLDGIGFADHCNVSTRPVMQSYRETHGLNLDQTYERRRSAIESLREDFDIRIFDAVEVDYHPNDEGEIREFLDTASFEYAIGSVHEIEGTNVHWDHFSSFDERERRAAVETYFDSLVALVESELFDIAAHLDVLERNTALRGYADETHYQRVAEALERTGTATEINAGRIHSNYGRFHPNETFLSIIDDYNVPIVAGSDSHRPPRIAERIPEIRSRFGEMGRDPAVLEGL